MDVTDSFSGFSCSLGTEVTKLVEKHRKDIKTTLKTDIEAIDSFLRGISSKRSRHAPSS